MWRKIRISAALLTWLVTAPLLIGCNGPPPQDPVPEQPTMPLLVPWPADPNQPR